jgi:hypothetical protein
VLLAAGRWVYVRTWLQASVVARLGTLGVTPQYSGLYSPSSSGRPVWHGSAYDHIKAGRVVVAVDVAVPFRSDTEPAEVNRLLRQLPYLVDACAQNGPRHSDRSQTADRHFAAAIDGLPLRGVLVRFIQLTGGKTAGVIRRTPTIEYVLLDGRVVPPPEELATICHSPHVKRLTLNNTWLTNEQLGVLADARQLNQLHLAGVYPYSRLAPLGRLPHCELELSPQGITDAELIDHIAPLPNLTWISLAFESPSEDAVASLAQAKRLRWVGLQDTEVGDDAIIPLDDLPLLHGLHVGGTNVTIKGLAHFSRCQSLRWLCVQETVDTVRVRKLLPHLDEVTICGQSRDAAATRQLRKVMAEVRQAAATRAPLP